MDFYSKPAHSWRRLDYYAASIAGTAMYDVITMLQASLGGAISSSSNRSRLRDVCIVQPSHGSAVMIGNDVVNGLVFVETKGTSSPALADVLRRAFPRHTVSRIDVCEDFDNPGAFAEITSAAETAKGRRPGSRSIVDHETGGRTWLAGKPASELMVRIYEPGSIKGREGRYGRDSARVELQWRPKYAKDKVTAATIEPLEVWGRSEWTRRIGEAVFAMNVPRATLHVPEKTIEGTFQYLARVARRTLTVMLQEGRGWQEVGLEFEAEWGKLDLIRADRKKSTFRVRHREPEPITHELTPDPAARSPPDEPFA